MALNDHNLHRVRISHWFNRAKRRPVGAFALIGLAFTAGLLLNWQSSAAWAADDSNLSKLERKLFHKDYSRDTADARLDRLEKMVFGEAKDGPEQERISNLLTAVPNLDAPAPAEEPTVAKSRSGQPNSASEPDEGQSVDSGGGRSQKVTESEPPPNASKYPAVTAIEQKLFGKEFGGEPVVKRLERLENKVFGHTSGIEDLSERVDRLKGRTGIDVAKQAPLGTDWADDDDDPVGPSSRSPVASGGEDGRSFSGRDLRRDLGVPSQGITDSWAGTGSYGMGGVPATPGTRAGNSRGIEDMTSRMVPQSAAPPPDLGGQPVGLNQQVGALEQEIFGKTFVRDALPARLSRLETTVFPQQKAFADRSLPDRVNRLLAVVPLSNGVQPQRSIAQNGGRMRQPDPDFAELDDIAGMQAGQPRAGSGLSKIINSIGSFLTGGYNGAYPVAPSGIVTDPQTGLWLDPRTGSLIDPITGAVVGQRLMQQGAGTMNGFGSFSNGFAPFGTQYGTGYGTGTHFGFGGVGRYGYGGMWP